jgi:hypothetical protein
MVLCPNEVRYTIKDFVYLSISIHTYIELCAMRYEGHRLLSTYIELCAMRYEGHRLLRTDWRFCQSCIHTYIHKQPTPFLTHTHSLTQTTTGALGVLLAGGRPTLQPEAPLLEPRWAEQGLCVYVYVYYILYVYNYISMCVCCVCIFIHISIMCVRVWHAQPTISSIDDHRRRATQTPPFPIHTAHPPITHPPNKQPTNQPTKQTNKQTNKTTNPPFQHPNNKIINQVKRPRLCVGRQRIPTIPPTIHPPPPPPPPPPPQNPNQPKTPTNHMLKHTHTHTQMWKTNQTNRPK